MYLIYTIILLVLALILGITLKEEVMARKGITHGIANKYWTLREKRRFVRFQEDIKIRYNRIGYETSQDNTKEKLKKNDALDVEIEVPGFSKPVRLTGSVMWVKELRSPDKDGRRMFYTGMKFKRISPGSEAILIAHLNTLKRP
jgi:hypothetical protein